MIKFLKKYGWIILLTFILTLGIERFCSQKYHDKEIEKRESKYNQLKTETEKLEEESIKVIEVLEQESDEWIDEALAKDKEIKNRDLEIRKLKSKSAEDLKIANAEKDEILSEKKKDEQKIKLQDKQISDLIESKAKLSLAIVNKNKVVDMWKENYFREKKLRIQKENDYNFLKEKSKKKWIWKILDRFHISFYYDPVFGRGGAGFSFEII